MAAIRSGVAISPAPAAADWQAIRELCCRTGNAGDPIEASRGPFFAELWIGPYQTILPAWTYVADVDGRVVGYLTGCPDTRAFRRRLLLATLPLLLRVASGRYPWNGDTRRFVHRFLGLERGPEARVRRTLPRSLWATHPAHLHMNVEAVARNQGIGGALLERYAADLRRAGVAGVHLLCGEAARGFYARHGFDELTALEVRPGVRVYALGLRLTERR